MRASRGDLALLPQGQDDYMSPSLKMPKGEVMTFWILTAALALATTAIFVRAALRGRDSGEPPAAYDLRVYRDQLKEIDRDAARGLIAAEEAERLRSEVSRRILAADTALTSGTASASAAVESSPTVGPEPIIAGSSRGTSEIIRHSICAG